MVEICADSISVPLEILGHKYWASRNKMNNYNRVLDALNGIFGYDDQVKSTFRKVRQFFDERTNEEVVIIEYRVRRDDLSKRKLLRSINHAARRKAR